MNKTSTRNWMQGVDRLVDGSKSELWPTSAAKQTKNQDGCKKEEGVKQTGPHSGHPSSPSLASSHTTTPPHHHHTHTHTSKHKPDSLLGQMASSRSRAKWGRLGLWITMSVPFDLMQHMDHRGAGRGWDHHVWCGGGVTVDAGADFTSDVRQMFDFSGWRKSRTVVLSNLLS